MKNTERTAIRKLLIAPLGALLVGLTYAAVPAGAEDVHAQLDFKETFYSDMSKTQEVGYNLYYCDNSIVSSGYETQYVTIYRYPPCE